MLGVRENFSERNRGSRQGAIVTNQAAADNELDFLRIVSPKITRQNFSGQIARHDFF